MRCSCSMPVRCRVRRAEERVQVCAASHRQWHTVWQLLLAVGRGNPHAWRVYYVEAKPRLAPCRAGSSACGVPACSLEHGGRRGRSCLPAWCTACTTLSRRSSTPASSGTRCMHGRMGRPEVCVCVGGGSGPSQQPASYVHLKGHMTCEACHAQCGRRAQHAPGQSANPPALTGR